MLSDAAAVIGAIGASTASILGGVALIIGAMNRRDIRTGNGMRIGAMASDTHRIAKDTNEAAHRTDDQLQGHLSRVERTYAAMIEANHELIRVLKERKSPGRGSPG